MSFWPSAGVIVGFQFGASGPFDTSTALPAVRDAQEITIKRGRSYWLDGFKAGTATARFQNQDRLLDPTYTSGTYYGQLLPRIGFRILANHTQGITPYQYDLFRGYTRGFPQVWGDQGTNSTSTVQAIDVFSILRNAYSSSTFSEELAGDRVVAVLDEIGFPGTGLYSSTFRNIDAGISLMQGITLDNRNLLEHLLHVQMSEFGRIFVDGAGRLVFQDRHALINGASSYTFSDDPTSGDLQYKDLELVSDDSEIYNRVSVTAIDGTEQINEDTASQTLYGRSDLPPRDNLLLTSDNEAARMSEYLLDRLKDPYARISKMVLTPTQGDFAEFDDCLSIDIGTVITVNRTPGGVGNTISQDLIVDGISHSISQGRGHWDITLDLSPADRETYWELDSATLSELGTTTRLAF